MLQSEVDEDGIVMFLLCTIMFEDLGYPSGDLVVVAESTPFTRRIQSFPPQRSLIFAISLLDSSPCLHHLRFCMRVEPCKQRERTRIL